MNALLSPADAAALLTAKTVSPAYIWPWLDVEACRLRAVVNAGGDSPCIVTGYAGFGDPISGVLTFYPQKIKAIQEKGERAICAVSGRGKDIFKVISRQPDGLLCLFPHGDNELISSHFIGETTHQGCALIDNPVEPKIIWHKDKPFITLQDKSILKEEERITIDPVKGAIWRGIQPILPVPEYTETLLSQVQTDFVTVAGHFLIVEDFCYFSKAFLDPKSIGLWTTEKEFLYTVGKKSLDLIWRDVLCDSKFGIIKHWESEAILCSFPQHYRLVDLHGIADFLPEPIKREVEQGQDHQEGTKAFDFRKRLYCIQIENAFKGYNKRDFYKKYPKAFILPRTTNGREVSCLVGVIREETDRLGISDLIGGGSMIEVDEALNNIVGIAQHCDTLCVGLGDLTASITGENRSNVSLKCWHKLDPRVEAKLARALQTVRKAKPSIFINVAGNQLNDPKSLEAILGMGVDQISLFPVKENVDRARLIICRHLAREALQHPNRPNSPRRFTPALKR
ncbi:MAG: putative PEP-binding protein [Bdellovibrionales bacterium]